METKNKLDLVTTLTTTLPIPNRKRASWSSGSTRSSRLSTSTSTRPAEEETKNLFHFLDHLHKLLQWFSKEWLIETDLILSKEVVD